MVEHHEGLLGNCHRLTILMVGRCYLVVAGYKRSVAGQRCEHSARKPPDNLEPVSEIQVVRGGVVQEELRSAVGGAEE